YAGAVSNAVSTAWNDVTTALAPAWNAVSTGWNDFTGWVGNEINQAISTIGGAYNQVSQWVTNTVSTVTHNAPVRISNVRDAWNSGVQQATTFVHKVYEGGQVVYQNALHVVYGSFQAVKQFNDAANKFFNDHQADIASIGVGFGVFAACSAVFGVETFG